MARTKTKTRQSRNGKGKGKGPQVKFMRDSSERVAGGNSMFLRLNTDDKFIGFALFDPDPAAEDNPGYVEYAEHWDNQNGRFVPCWGAKNGCIYCKAGQAPSQRAQAAFLVTSINGEELDEPEVRLFRLNWTMMQEWGDTLDEDGSTLGQKVRIKCQSRDDGDYITKFYDKDRLSKKDLKSSMKDIPEIEEVLQKSLDRALEALSLEAVLESDDDDDEDDDEEEPSPKSKSKSKSKTSKRSKKDEDEEDDDEDEEDDDEEEDDESDDEDEEESEDDEDDEDEESESDEDDEDEESDDDEDEEEGETLEGDYTLVSTSESEMTFSFKELDNDVYVGQDIVDDVDFDDFKKGDKVHVVAAQDDDEDWVATEITKVEKKKNGGKGKGGKKKK
jgi:hypothetical protein